MATILCAISAKAINITVNIDNPEAVTFTYYDATSGEKKTVEPESEVNTYDVKNVSMIAVNAKDGWYIGEGSDGTTTKTMPGNGKEYSLNIIGSSSTNFTVKTVKESDFKNATFTLKYDDAAQVKAVLDGTKEEITLNPDENEVTVSFSSEFEKTLTLSNPDGKKLYSVTVGEQSVDITGKSVTVDLTPDAVVDVVAIYPDVDVPVHLHFSDLSATGFITSVTVDGENIEPLVYLGLDFKVKAGSLLVLTANVNDYNVTKTSVNGEEFEFNYFNDYKYTYQVVEETTFYFEVEAYPVIQKKIIVEGAEYFTFYKGYSWDGDNVELHDGENIVEFVEEEYGILASIELDPDYYLAEFNDNGTDLDADDYDPFEIESEGDLIITVKKIVKDKKFVMYIDDKDLTNNFSLQNEYYQKYNVNTGYNEIEFYDGDGQEWYCNWAQTNGANQMFINDEEHEGYWGSANMHYFEPENNDVVRVYLGQTPAKVNVTFNVEEGLTPQVTRDILTPVTDLATPLEVFPQTRFNIDSTGTPLKVKVGDEPEFVSETPEFVVTKPVTVTIKKDTSVGIEEINVFNNANAIYDLQGRKVAKTGKGLYIINGKKVAK